MSTSGAPSMPEIKGFGQDILSNKEKWVGRVFTGLIIGAGIFALNALLPWVNIFLGNLIEMIGKAFAVAGLLALAAAVAVIAMHPRTHTLIGLAFRKLARGATMLLIKYMPSDVLEGYKEYLLEKGQRIAKLIQNVDGRRQGVADTIDRNKEEIEEKTGLAKALESRYYDKPNRRWTSDDYQLQFRGLSQSIGFLTKSNGTLEKQLKRMELYVKLLKKFRQAYEYRRQVTNNFCDVLDREYLAMKDSAEATKLMADAFGTDDMKLVFHMTVKFMQERIAKFASTVDSFIEENMPSVMQMELEGDVSEDRLLASIQSLEAMDAQADQLISDATEEGEALEDPNRLAALIKAKGSAQVVSSAMPKKRRYLTR